MLEATATANGYNQFVEPLVYFYYVWLTTSQGNNFLLLLCGVLFTALLYTLWGNYYMARIASGQIRYVKRGITMTPKERELYVREQVEDMIADGLEDLVLAKRMSSHEAMEWMRKLGGMKGLPGLLPKAAVKAVHLPPDIVKEGIKQRRAERTEQEKEPVPLPDSMSTRPVRPGSRLSQRLNGTLPKNAHA